jgi:vacuolar-type H+-ATPase subunit H
MKKDIIIKETLNEYINEHILKEYNATDNVRMMFQEAMDKLYQAYNAMIQDVNAKQSSKREIIILQLEKDIQQLSKDIKYIH